MPAIPRSFNSLPKKIRMVEAPKQIRNANTLIIIQLNEALSLPVPVLIFFLRSMITDWGWDGYIYEFKKYNRLIKLKVYVFLSKSDVWN